MQYKYFPHEGRGGLSYSFSAVFFIFLGTQVNSGKVRGGSLLSLHKYLLSIDLFFCSEAVIICGVILRR